MSLCHSPVKFASGGCWPRGSTGCPSLLSAGSSVEQPMEMSTVEQMDTSSSSTSEASAPLPIKHPSGINAGPYKKQAYPMNSKRPEHLRMNLWRTASVQNIRTLPIPPPSFLSFPFKETCRIFFLKKVTDTVNADHQLFQQRLPFSSLGLPKSS